MGGCLDTENESLNNWEMLLLSLTLLLLVGCLHSLVYLHLLVVEGLIFCISATPHLGTSFPLFHGLSKGGTLKEKM